MLFRPAFLVATLGVVSIWAVPVEAQTPSSPPEGTIASEMSAGDHGASAYGGLVDVTAVNTTLIAFDDDGRPVLDLRPEELLVLEDGQPVRLIGLEPGVGPSSDFAAGLEKNTDAALGATAAGGDQTPWRVVVYVGTELAGRFVLKGLCRETAESAARLTGLEISAAVVNVSEQSRGFHQGDLRVTAALGDLRATLNPLDLGEVRITLVVDVGKTSPFISHQEFPVEWGEVRDVWQYTSGFRWRKNAHRVAVVVEELVTSTWGAAVIELD